MFAEDRGFHSAAVCLGSDAVNEALCTLREERIFNHCEQNPVFFWSDAEELCVFGYYIYLKAESEYNGYSCTVQKTVLFIPV